MSGRAWWRRSLKALHEIAAIGDRIVFVGTDAAGVLKDYFGEFKPQ